MSHNTGPPKKRNHLPKCVLACSNCRIKKIKCDKRSPCSNCKRCGISCTGYNVHTQDPVPRSIVQHLEEEIALLKSRLREAEHRVNSDPVLEPREVDLSLVNAQHQHPSADVPPVRLSNVARRHKIKRQHIRGCPNIQRIINATIPSSTPSTLSSRVGLGLTPSLAPFTSRELDGSMLDINQKNESKETGIGSGITTRHLENLPHEIIRRLVANFMLRKLPILPYLDINTVWNQVDIVFRKLEHRDLLPIIPDYDLLIIYLILANAVTLGSARSGQIARCLAFSESLFREGLQHLAISSHTLSGLQELQAMLLILCYATANPRCGNVYLLSGTCMRACLELGLHREPPSLEFDEQTSDLRRRLFWIAYNQDRCNSAALQRPLSIPDPAIDAKYFSLSENSLSPTDLPNSMIISNYAALHWIAYRRLQSTVVEVHFHSKPLDPGQSWEDWLQSMERRLRDWYEEGRQTQEWSQTAFTHALTSIYRPSPRVPLPTPESLLIAFENASMAAKSYGEDLRSGQFRRPWLATHHTFTNAMIVLFCLRHARDKILSKFNVEQIFEMTKLFTSNLLSISLQAWPEISKYAGIYERLLGPLLESVFAQGPADTFSPEQDAELTRLLYPGPAQLERLRFGGAVRAPPVDLDFSMFDFALWDEDFVMDGTSTPVL